MGNKNIFIRIWEEIISFLRTFTGIEQRDLINDFIREFITYKNAFQKEADERKKFEIKQFQLMYGIRRKAFFPILIGKKGNVVNMNEQRYFKTELIFNPEDSTLEIELQIDQRLFEKYEIDLKDSYVGNVNKPLITYAADKFQARDRNFMDECSKNFVYGIIAFAFEKEVLQTSDILEIFGKTILEISRPGYIESMKLQDFVIDKGPVEKPEQKELELVTFPAKAEDVLKIED